MEKLEDYFRRVVLSLRGKGVTLNEVVRSFENAVPRDISRHHAFLLVCYPFALVVGSVFTAIITAGGLYYDSSGIFYLLAPLLLLGISLFTYFSFNNFNLRKIYLLILMSTVGILILMPSYFIYSELTLQLKRLSAITSAFGTAGAGAAVSTLTPEPMAFAGLAAIVMLTYIIVPLLFLILSD